MIIKKFDPAQMREDQYSGLPFLTVEEGDGHVPIGKRSSRHAYNYRKAALWKVILRTAVSFVFYGAGAYTAYTLFAARPFIAVVSGLALTGLGYLLWRFQFGKSRLTPSFQRFWLSPYPVVLTHAHDARTQVSMMREIILHDPKFTDAVKAYRHRYTTWQGLDRDEEDRLRGEELFADLAGLINRRRNLDSASVELSNKYVAEDISDIHQKQCEVWEADREALIASFAAETDRLAFLDSEHAKLRALERMGM